MTYNRVLYLTHFLNTIEAQDIKRCIDSEHAKKGLNRLASHSEQGLLLATVIALMSYQGLRVAEVMGLQKTHITVRRSASGNLAAMKLKIIGKGKKIRAVRLGVFDSYLLNQYMSSELYGLHPSRVFSVSADTPIYYNFLDRRLKALLGAKFGAHDFRRGYTFQASANGKAFNAISNQLGHTAMDTTRIYDKRSITRLERDFRNPHPELIDSFPHVGNARAGDFLELDRLEEAFSKLVKPRDKLAFALIAFAGVKASEVVDLRRADFKKTCKRLQVGGRLIPLHDHVSELLADWCDSKNLRPSEPILNGSVLNSANRVALTSQFQRLSKSLPFRINGKLLRASFIVAELNRGVDPISLANICGCTYSNIARYIPCACDARAAALERRVTM